MSEIKETVEGTPRGLRAGNTVETMNPTDISTVNTVEPEAVAEELTAVPDTAVVTDAVDTSVDDENTFDVSRAEFDELRDAFIRLLQRVEKHNTGAPHKI